MWGATTFVLLLLRKCIIFQSTLPVWGATHVIKPFDLCSGISIHAPRVGSDLFHCQNNHGREHFNPRSPCGERPNKTEYDAQAALFQSTLPVWGATGGDGDKVVADTNFNPRSPCGERLFTAHKITQLLRFQSTLPVWGATYIYISSYTGQFQSTLPVWGATRNELPARISECISIHAPRVGSD